MGNRLEAIARGGCRQQISRVALSIAAGDQKAFLASGINNSFSCRRQFGKAFTSFPQADAPVFLASELPGSYLNLRSGRLYHFIHQRGNIKRTMTFHAAALPAATLSGQGTQLDAHPGLAAAGGLSEAAVSDSAEVGVDMQEAQTRGEGSGGVSTSRGSGDKGAKSNPGSLRFRERIMIDRVFEELGLDKLSAQVKTPSAPQSYVKD